MGKQDQETENEQAENQEKKGKKGKEKTPAPKDESSIAFFLNSSLFVFFVTAWAFVRFLYSNRYPLVLNNEVLPEVIAVFAGLLVFSFLVMFLLSPVRFLARVFLSFVAGASAAYLLGVYSPYNVGEYIASFLGFLPHQAVLSIAANGNLIVGVLVGFAFFAAVNIIRGGAMALLSLPALCALFYMFNASAQQRIPLSVEKKAALAQVEEGKGGENQNLVYLMLADHAGYAYAREKWAAKAGDKDADDKTPYFVNDFYQDNGFAFYPHVYSRFPDRYRSVASVLNPSKKEIKGEMFGRGTGTYYSSSEDARVTFSENELFKKLKEAGYNLNVYQSHPFNFCDGAESGGISGCFTYPAPIGALHGTDLSLTSKVALLVGHWLNSSPLGRGLVDAVRGKLIDHHVKISDFPIIGVPYVNSTPVGQADLLMQLREDLKKAQGKNVFFAHLALPHYPYVYDRFCRLKKDPRLWRINKPYAGVSEPKEEERRWDQYNQQLFCTYAQLNAAIRDWEASGDLKNTKIVIHGDKGAGIVPSAKDIQLASKLDQAMERMKRNSSTVFAVYPSASKKAEVKASPCDLGSLVKMYVLGEKPSACVLPELNNPDADEKAKLEKWLASPVAGIDFKPKEKYSETYAKWLESGGQSFLSATDLRRRRLKGEDMPAAVRFVEPPEKSATKDDGSDKAPETQNIKTEIVPVPAENAEKTAVDTDVAGANEESGEPAGLDNALIAEEEEFSGAEMPEPDVSGNVSETEEILIEEEAEATPEPIALPDLDVGQGQNKWKLLDEAGDGSAPSSVKAGENGGFVAKETPEVQNIAEISEADVGNESETEGFVSLEALPVPAVPEEEKDIAVLPAESDEDGTADEKTPLFAEEGKEVRDDAVALPEMQVSQETETVALPAFDDLVDAEGKDNISLSEADETMEQQLLAKLNAETKALLETPVDVLISGGTVAQKTEEPANIAIEDAIGQKAEKTEEEKVLQEPADSVVAGVSEPVISETVEAVTVSEQKAESAVPDAEPSAESKGGKDESVRKTEVAAGTSVKTPAPVEENAEKVEEPVVVATEETVPETTENPELAKALQSLIDRTDVIVPVVETVEAVTVSEQKAESAVSDAEPATEPKSGKDESVRKTEVAAGTSVKTPAPVEENAEKVEEPVVVATEETVPETTENPELAKALQSLIDRTEEAKPVVAEKVKSVISKTAEFAASVVQKAVSAVQLEKTAVDGKGGKGETVGSDETVVGTPVPVEEKTSGVKAEKVEKSAVVAKKETMPEKTVKTPAVQKKTAKKTVKPAVKARKSVKTAKAKASSGKPAAKVVSKAPETAKPAKAAVLPAQKSAVKKTETVQKRKADKTVTDKTVKIVPPIEMFETEVADVPPAPPEPANKDELDITRETITEGFSPVTGEKETYIFIERWRNPKRFKKRASMQKSMKSGGLDKRRATIQKELQNDELDKNRTQKELLNEVLNKKVVEEKTLYSEMPKDVSDRELGAENLARETTENEAGTERDLQ